MVQFRSACEKGINGFYAPCISHDLVWNRVANSTGNKDSKNAIDLVNEMINNSFKDILKRAHGRYTAAEENRSSILCWPFGKCLDDVFLSTLKSKADVVHSSNNNLYLEDIHDFLLQYSHDRLFKHTPGRLHPTFANTTLNNAIKEPQKLRERLRSYTRVIHLRKDIIPNQIMKLHIHAHSEIVHVILNILVTATNTTLFHTQSTTTTHRTG